MGDTAMQLNPVLWTEPLVTDRDQFKESSTNDADEEEESSSTSFTQQQQNPTFEILEPNHSFLYSTILARNLQQVTKTAFLNLSLATTTEIAEDASVDVILQSDGETKEICSSHNSVEDEKPTHKRTTPCKRISYKIKRSSSGYRKLNNRNPIRGSTVAELASKFDKLCSEKKYILDDPKFAQIIKRVNSQNYSQGDAGKINRKSSVKMSIEEKSSRKPSSRQNSNNNNNDEATSQNSDHGINVRAAIKIFEDRQVNDTKNLQLKPRIPEKKMFTKSLEVIPNNIGDFSENDREKDDFDEVPVLIVNIEKTIRSESAYEMSHVKLKNKISKSLRNGLEEVKSTSAALSKVSEEDNNLYDLVVPPSLAKPVVDKKIQPPVPPKPKNIENRRIVKKKTVETIDQIGKNPNLFEGNKSEGLEDLPSRIDRISESINEKALKIIEQEKAYEELSVPPSEATHSYEDIEQKSDDGYEAIIPLNLLEQNIYETLPSVRDCPPPLPKRQEELLPPKLPAKNSYYKVHHSQDETNSYEIIDTCNIFRTNVVSEVSSESSYDTLMQLKFNCNSNRASVISCDQQSNSLYGRSIPDWTEDCLNSKVDSDSFSDRSDDWCDVDDNEDGHYTESIVVQKKKTSRSYTRKPCDTNSEAETDHHYESVPEGFLQNHYVAESFDSDYDISDNRLNVPYNNIDISNTQLPDTPHYQTNVLDRLSTAGKNLKRLFYKNDITKSLGRITKKKSRTDLDNLNNSLDRSKSSSKLTSDNSSTPRNSLTSQDSNSEQSYVDTNYDKQKFKSKAKSTFYLTDTIDIGSNDKVDSDGRKNSLSPVNKIKSKNSKSSPVRPSVPPPPLPKQLNPNASDNKRSTSWYVESSPFKNIENTPSIGKRSTASWYAEVGLYREGPRSTPSTSSAENSGSGISNRNEFDEINYENTEEYHNLRNETEYNNSIDSSGSNETKMDKSCTSLSEDMQHILQEEPLYQFYNAAIVDSLCHEGTDWDSDGYEEISKNEGSETRLRPSAMDLITTNGNNVSVSRTLWCEIPEVKQSEVFSTLTLDQKKLQEAKFEMMTSEASYLNSLNVLTKHFIQNLYKCKTASKEDMDTIFMKIPSVKNCSEKLLQDLEKCWQDNILLQDICNIIHRHAEENFSVYITYVENQVLLERTLKKLRDVTEFRDTLQRLETSMDCQALTLYSFLMLPMQRVTRWPLLLDAVLKRLSPSDNEYLACQYALTTINKIANQCNEAARRKEREAEMKTIVNRLDFGPRKPAFNLMSEGRWLIKSGAVTQMLARGDDGKLTFGKKLVKKPLFLFLFNDLFIVTKYQASEDNYSVIHYCPRNMIEINVDMAPNLPVKDTANRHLVFLTILENQYEKLVEILFSCNTTTDKERWLNALATAKSEDPDETLYERWDCPQVTAVYDYNVDQPDELNITKGDTIYVIRKMSDGWYYGERLRDGECGWFPANYVVEIVNPHVRARNLRQRYRLLAFTQTYFNTSKQ